MDTTWLGEVEYRRALDLQLDYVDRRADGRISDTLLLLTHPAVYTIGRAGDISNLLVSEEELSAEGIRVERVSRGGDITWHGPGQIVGYPIVMMARPDLHRFVRAVESALIEALGALGTSGERIPGRTGVWVGGRKIASIGIGVRRWVTYHGFALNVGEDLSGFRRIHPCGIKGLEATSVSGETGRPVSPEEVREIVASSCASNLCDFG